MRWLLLLASVLAACGDHVGDAASGTTRGATAVSHSAIPWISAPPVFPSFATPAVPPVPKGIPRCDPSALRLDPGDYQGAMGSLVGAVFLESTTSQACLIEGGFITRFITQRGHVALVTEVPRGQNSDFLRPGWAIGRAMIEWQAFWCHPDDPIVAIAVTFEGVTLTAQQRPFTGGHVCSVQPPPEGGATVMPLGSRPTPLPMPTPLPLRATIAAPASVRAGETLVYEVTITNVSATAVALQPCPFYLEWLGGRVVGTTTPPPGLPSGKAWDVVKTYAGAAKESYSLNCEAVREITPGESVTFEMRLRVPLDALGNDTLRWSIAGPSQEAASASIVIEGAR